LSREPNPKKTPREETAGGFEARLERLREIVEELEGGELPLEKAIARYEEGVSVLKVCAETLANARLRVEELTRDADESLGLRDAKDLEEAAEGGQGDDD
jgi:exodeoxyribonuclease VII small subunit